MDYKAQLTGKTPIELSLTPPITQSQVLGNNGNPVGEIAKLNFLYINNNETGTGSQQVSTMNVTGVIPVLYTPNSDDEFYYTNTDITTDYVAYPKIHEAHIPYLHGQLINHGTLPFNVYHTVADLNLDPNDDTNVVSALDASDLINNVARVLVTDTDNNISLLGYNIQSNNNNPQVEVVTLSTFKFNDDASTPVNDWAIPVNAL